MKRGGSALTIRYVSEARATAPSDGVRSRREYDGEESDRFGLDSAVPGMSRYDVLSAASADTEGRATESTSASQRKP